VTASISRVRLLGTAEESRYGTDKPSTSRRGTPQDKFRSPRTFAISKISKRLDPVASEDCGAGY
jgi:hypothetical protein